MKQLLALILLLLSAHCLALADDMPLLTAKHYVLLDQTSNQVLVSHNADKRIEPASLTKLMTAYLVFEAINQGTLMLEQEISVPEEVTRLTSGESRMFLKAGQTPTVNTLLRGLIVQSGNDAAITLATHIAGSQEAFVKLMNQTAKRLGLRNTYFTNPTGMPDPGHYSTAADLAKLAATIVQDYPQRYSLFSEREFTFNNFSQSNQNRLLWLDPYVDGIKTSYNKRAGYCLITSAKRGERRLISVLLGAKSDNIRTRESQKLLNFGFQSFDTVRLYQKEQAVTRTHVWEGTDREIPIGFEDDLILSVPKGQLKQLKATLKLYQPIVAPISRGQKLGILKLTLAGESFSEYPIVALDKVSVANIFSRGWDNIRLFIHNL